MMSDGFSHDSLFWEIFIFAVTGLATWAIMSFKVNLMWKDFKHRHQINGEK
jgi:hypothetical protein